MSFNPFRDWDLSLMAVTNKRERNGHGQDPNAGFLETTDGFSLMTGISKRCLLDSRHGEEAAVILERLELWLGYIFSFFLVHDRATVNLSLLFLKGKEDTNAGIASPLEISFPYSGDSIICILSCHSRSNLKRLNHGWTGR
jgi:hypothetical protein